MIIKTKGFILRPYRKSDIINLQKNANHKEIYRYTLRIPYPYTLKDARNFIKRDLRFQKAKKKTVINFAIEIKKEVIGGISIEIIEGHKAEIGYWLAKKDWNKKIMTKAVKEVSNFIFKKLKLKRIYAYINMHNKRSLKVLKNNNFQREGLLRKFAFKDGKYIDTYIYAKIK